MPRVLLVLALAVIALPSSAVTNFMIRSFASGGAPVPCRPGIIVQLEEDSAAGACDHLAAGASNSLCVCDDDGQGYTTGGGGIGAGLVPDELTSTSMVFWNTLANPDRLETSDCEMLQDPDDMGWKSLDCPAAVNSGQTFVLKESAAAAGTEEFSLSAPANMTSSYAGTLTALAKIPADAVAVIDCDTLFGLDALGYGVFAAGFTAELFRPPTGATRTVTKVRCAVDALASGGTTVQVQRNDGTPADMLSADLACTDAWASSILLVGAESSVSDVESVRVSVEAATTAATTLSICVEWE
jgi:hypothetical protein